MAVAVTVAACGGYTGAMKSTASSAPSGAGGKTVSVKQVSGIGSVLVDTSGAALYTPAQEAGGKVLCRRTCISIWKPVTPGRGKPTGASGAGKLAVLTRPDGTKQVTVKGKPLYTFVQDSPGHVTGNGKSDTFGTQRFTWHVVLAGGKPATSSGGGGGSGAPSGGVPGY
jgi:predicted lipoprotein with Yx(FWY)xxD motif